VCREKREGGARRSARTRSWPSSYLDPPLLIVADNEVCQAAVCTAPAPSTTAPASASPAAVNNGGVATADDTVFSAVVDLPPQLTASQLIAAGPDHPPPPLRTQRSDPGPTSADRTVSPDQPVARTADPNTVEAPP